MVRAGVLVWFLTLEESFQFSPCDEDVSCGLFTNGLKYVGASLPSPRPTDLALLTVGPK